jgi:hypothetical protein
MTKLKQSEGLNNPQPSKVRDIRELPEYILRDLLEYVAENDNIPMSREAALLDIAKMSADELFRIYCEWNGIIGYSSRLSEVLDSLRRWAAPRTKFHHAEQFSCRADAPRLFHFSDMPALRVVIYVEGVGLKTMDCDRDEAMRRVGNAYPGLRRMYMGMAEVL